MKQRIDFGGKFMKKYTQKRQRLQRDLGERKAHFKLYKAGKLWLFAGVATVSFGLYASFGSITMAQADSTNAVTANAATDTQSNTVTLNSSQTPTTTESNSTGATSTGDQTTGTESANETGTTDAVNPAVDTDNSGEKTGNPTDSSQSTSGSLPDSTETSEASQSEDVAAPIADSDTTDDNAADTSNNVTNAAKATTNTAITNLDSTTKTAATPMTKSLVSPTSTTPDPTSTAGVSTSINNGTANTTGTTIYNSTTSGSVGSTIVTVSGSFNAGDVVTVALDSNGFKTETTTSLAGAVVKQGNTTVNGVSVPLTTVTFNEAVSAASFSTYYSFQSYINNSSLADGQAQTVVPVTVSLNNEVVATNSVVVDKQYSLTKNGSGNIGYNLFNAGSKTTVTGGLIKDGSVTQNITWQMDLSGNRYPGDYTTIPSDTNVTTMSEPSILTIKLPDTVQFDQVSLDASLVSAGITLTQTDDQTVNITYPAGTKLASLSSLVGNFNANISAITAPTTTTNYGNPTLTMTWNVDGNSLTATDTKPSSRSTLLQYTVQSLATVNDVSFKTDANTDLTTLGDSTSGSNQLNWQVADASNYAYGGTFNGTLSISSSAAETPFSIQSVSGLSDTALAKMGLSKGVSLIFTTASGQQDTQSYASGTGTYTTTIGSATDPVTSVQLQETTPMTTPSTTATGAAALIVGVTAFDATTPTQLTATSKTTITTPDGALNTTEKDATATRNYSDTGAAVVGTWGPGSSQLLNYGDTIKINPQLTIGNYGGNQTLPTLTQGVLMADTGAKTEAVMDANPLTIVMVAPTETSFVSDATITQALVNSKIASVADNITITHLADSDNRQVIAISGLNRYLGNGILVPVVVNADATPGTKISSQNTVYIQPSSTIMSANGTKLTTLGSLADDWAAGNMYNVTAGTGQLGIVIASSSFNTYNAVQGSADSAAQTSTGTLTIADDQASGKTMLYNGTTTALTDSQTTVNLVDATTGTQSIHLTAPVTVTDANGNAVSGATVTYYANDAVVTDPTQADRFTVGNVALASKAVVTVGYALAVDADQLTGITSGKQWQYSTSVQSYSAGTVAGGDATALGTATTKTMTLAAVHTLSDNWYQATKDAAGNLVQGALLGTYTGSTGMVYSGTKTANLAGAVIGQALPDDDQVVFLGVVNLTTGQSVTDPGSITMTENLARDGSVVGSNYAVVVGPRYSTTTKPVTYTVTYSGAGTATPPTSAQTVDWTGVTDAVSGTTTWTAATPITSVTPTAIEGYTVAPTSVFDNIATTSTTTPSDMTVNVVYTANSETVTVHHYLEGTTTAVSADQTLTGDFNTTYRTTPATVTGYTATTPANATGVYGTTNADVIYYYTANDENVTVHYVLAGTGATIAPDTTVSGKYNDAYTTTAANLTGYTLSATPTNATGTFTENTPAVTYTYTANSESVTVHHYLEGTTISVSPDVTLDGDYNTAYTSSAETPTGYTLATTPANATGTFTENTPAVTYTYTANPESVTVHHYLEGTTTSVSPDVALDGDYNTAYTASAATPTGYTLATTPTNATGTFTESNDPVIYYYTANKGSVLVHHYLKGTTTSVSPDVTLDGDYNTAYTASAVTPTGYTLAITPSNATGTYTESNKPVIYYYTANEENVLVHHYLKGTTTSVSPDVKLTGEYNTNYTASAVTPTGYTLATTPTNATGTYTESNKPVIYYYTANEENVLVHHYLKGTTTSVSPDVTLTGDYNTAYTASAVTPTGYTLATTPSNATGTYTESNKPVIYYYTANEENVLVHHYLKGTTTSVSPDVTLTGDYNTAYTASAVTPTGYTLTTTPTNTTGTFAESNDPVIYYYTANKESVLVHHYLEGTTTSVSPDVTLTGDYNTAYTTSAAPLTGYSVSETPVNASGTFDVTNADVIYYYSPNTESLTVHYYADNTTTSVSPDTTVTGKYGSDYTTEPATVPGYKLVGTPENATGTFGTDNSAVIYFYAVNQGSDGGTTTPGGNGTDTGATIPGGNGTDTGTTTPDGNGTDTGTTTPSGNGTDTGTTTPGGNGTNTGITTPSGADNSTAMPDDKGTNSDTATPGTTSSTKISTGSGIGTDTDNGTAAKGSNVTAANTNTEATTGNGSAANTGASVGKADTSTDLQAATGQSTPAANQTTESVTKAKLPQTSDQANVQAETAGLALLAGVLGLFGFGRKRRHNRN